MSAPLTWRRAGPGDRALALLAALAGAGALGLVPFLPLLARLAPACPFHVLTGLPCPACGSTRAVLALARGDLAAAVAWNPLATLGAVAFALVAALALPWVAARGPLPVLAAPRLPWRLRLAAVAGLGAQWLWLVARGT